MHLQKEFVPYPYFIMYNFEALLMTLQSAQTSHLMFASAHIPVSIVVNDNLTNKPTFLDNVNSETLIQSFIEELTHWQEIISKQVWSTYPMTDEHSFPKQAQSAWTD